MLLNQAAYADWSVALQTDRAGKGFETRSVRQESEALKDPNATWEAST